MRRLLFGLLAIGCGKELNPVFCRNHPGDSRCVTGMQDVDAATQNPDAATTDLFVATCPTTYTITITGSTSKYRTETSMALWPAAAADCADDGATTHLAVLSSSAERIGLAPHANPFRYIGHSDRRVEGEFRAVTDEPDTYPELAARQRPPWANNEPAGRGDCVALVDANDELYDADCTMNPAGYICECDAHPDDPSNY